MRPDLALVLNYISAAKTVEELRLIVPAAGLLQEADKDIARWSYSYAFEQLSNPSVLRRAAA